MQPSCLISFPSFFPRPGQSPLLPQKPENSGRGRGQQVLAQKVVRCASPTDGKLCSQGSAVFMAPSCTNLHGIHIQPTLYFHTFKATHLYPLTGWKEPSLPKVFPPQSHPNTGTDSELGFWGQRLLLTEGFLSFNTTRVCWSSMCTKALLTQAPFRKEIREQCSNTNSVHVCLQFSAATLVSCCSFDW